MTHTMAPAAVETAQQICPADMEAIAGRGFKSIICNRPDGEEGRQWSAAEIAQAARRHGLAFAHIPVVSGAITAADVATMRDTLAHLTAPVLAYCRSGSRSRQLLNMIASAAR
ncbi:TIGR01244 family phosphatase [Roseomonas aeriglobus]|nr:TIGR01244 family phosphatase [Roseomonas aeriglobus]